MSAIVQSAALFPLFFTLPRELRDTIYELALEPGNSQPRVDATSSYAYDLRLLQVNRTVNKEAEEVFHRVNKLVIIRVDVFVIFRDGSNDFQRFLAPFALHALTTNHYRVQQFAITGKRKMRLEIRETASNGAQRRPWTAVVRSRDLDAFCQGLQWLMFSKIDFSPQNFDFAHHANGNTLLTVKQSTLPPFTVYLNTKTDIFGPPSMLQLTRLLCNLTRCVYPGQESRFVHNEWDIEAGFKAMMQEHMGPRTVSLSAMMWEMIEAAHDMKLYLDVLYSRGRYDQIIDLVNKIATAFDGAMQSIATLPASGPACEPMARASVIIMDCKALQLTCCLEQGKGASVIAYGNSVAAMDVSSYMNRAGGNGDPLELMVRAPGGLLSHGELMLLDQTMKFLMAPWQSGTTAARICLMETILAFDILRGHEPERADIREDFEYLKSILDTPLKLTGYTRGWMTMKEVFEGLSIGKKLKQRVPKTSKAYEYSIPEDKQGWIEKPQK
ncbi:Hypothetical predicted protein [Lecanosticta acicola]|uniref:Uncharacterized protein n=1 Tax=Lecanosticta acicola TaxID=111012 RepID=A0AAI8Z5K8_9PEZI|nr:Hypothetical predicted protein [Lecanosticta acicola]